MNGSTGDEMDVVYSLLGASERRYLLYQLAENGQGNLDSLTTNVAAWEHELSPDAVDETLHQRTYVALVHNHLPRLADHGVLEYDLRSGDVVLAEGFEDLEPLLEQFRRTDALSEDGGHEPATTLGYTR